MEACIKRSTGMHIPHGTMHCIRDADSGVQKAPKGIRRRTRIRWERGHLSTMWHTDLGSRTGGGSSRTRTTPPRRLPAYGAFEMAAAASALAVLHIAIERHGRPASIMADHGSQFFADEADGHRRWEAAFKSKLKRLGIRHVVARIAHPQTNGKI